MKKFWIIWLGFVLSYSVAQAQSIVSDNILTPSTGAWTGTVTGAAGGAGPNAGGTTPAFNPNTNTIIFGYTNATATQSISAEAFAIQHALDLSNSGIKINGYNYSWQIDNSGMNAGSLSGKVDLTSGGVITKTYTYNYNAPTNGFELKTGTETFDAAHTLLSTDSLSLSFTGMDSKFWAGYWGPRVRDPSITLNYTTDPCWSNPLYSPSCSGYNSVLNSQRMYAESYAINQALDLVGAGLKINGLKYGYDYVLGGTWCSVAGMNPDGTLGCSTWEPSYIAVGVAVTKSNGSTLYSNSYLHQEQNSSGSVNSSHVLSKPVLLPDMGGFALVDQVNGTGAVFNKWSNWQYTPDPCVINPLSSTSCSGYQAAFLAQQCAADSTYDSACPGYAQAIFTRQCTASPLSNQACPGYAAAYLNYQCSANPLYSTTCAGYAEAYLNSQCIKDSLYSTKCEGYATAYAIKYLVTGIDSSAVNQSLSDTAATKANDPSATKVAVNTVTTSINSDGSVTAGVSATGDTNVDRAITAKASTPSGSQPAAAVQLTQAPPPPPPPARNERNEGGDKKEGGEKKADGEKPAGGDKKEGGPQQAQGGDSKPEPTARQQLQARREAAAKAEAVSKGKELANEMGKVDNMEQQKHIQNVVIQAMGFTAGFDSYNNFKIFDNTFYKPVNLYGGTNVDNRNLGRGLFGATDRMHNEMVESQFKLTK